MSKWTINEQLMVASSWPSVGQIVYVEISNFIENCLLYLKRNAYSQALNGGGGGKRAFNGQASP